MNQGQLTDAEIERLLKAGQIPEAKRIRTVEAKPCPECGRRYPHEAHTLACRMRKFMPWK